MEHTIFRLLITEALPVAFVVLFISSIVEYIFPPFPGDTVMLFGAFLAGRDVLSIPLVFAAGTLGSFAGSLLVYVLGRALGRDYFLRKDFSFFSAEKVTILEGWFARWGGAIIAVNRFAPGFRSFFFVAAGIAKMPLFKVAVYSLVSVILWNLGVFYLGYRMGQQWEKMKGFLELYSNVVIIFIAGVIIIYIIFRIIASRRKKAEKSDSYGGTKTDGV